MMDYALAVFAHLRGEAKPDWADFLEINSRTYFKKSLKYIEKTGESKFKIL